MILPAASGTRNLNPDPCAAVWDCQLVTHVGTLQTPPVKTTVRSPSPRVNTDGVCSVTTVSRPCSVIRPYAFQCPDFPQMGAEIAAVCFQRGQPSIPGRNFLTQY